MQTVGEVWVRVRLGLATGSRLSEHDSCHWNSGTSTVGAIPNIPSADAFIDQVGPARSGMTTASKG